MPGETIRSNKPLSIHSQQEFCALHAVRNVMDQMGTLAHRLMRKQMLVIHQSPSGWLH